MSSRLRPGRQVMHVLLACLGLHLVWAFAMPVTTGPDEDLHVYRAISLWDGDFLPSAREPAGQWLVQVPSSVFSYAESTACNRWKPRVPAGCFAPAEVSGDVTTVENAAARYFPLYYYAVGWPGDIDPTVTGFYAMRVVSSIVSSVLLALAIVTVLRTIGARWAALVLPIAITPQVLWLGSVVNPNAWEVDAGLLTWAAGLALVSRLSTERREALWVKFLVGATFLVLMRRLSPLWLVLIVGGVLAVRLCLPVRERSTLRSLVSGRALPVLGLVVCLAGVSAWWHLTFDLATLNGLVNPHPAPGGLVQTVAAILPDVPWWIGQTYGVFGYLDATSPVFAVLAWMGLGSGVFVLVILGSTYRLRVAVTAGLGVALWVAIPVAFDVTVGGTSLGIYFWQARYTMPFGQGIPLALGVLGACWRGRSPELENVVRRISPAVAWLFWPVLGTLSVVWALHRYARGQDADWNVSDLQWSSPGIIAGLLAVYAVSGIALVRSLRKTAPSRQDPVLDPDLDPPGHIGIGAGLGAAGRS